jgi:hypothetical protein
MRRFASTALAVTLLVSASPITAQQKPVEEQIAEAVSALPEPMREGATVLAFVGGDSLSVVRMGLNMMICLADDPKIEGFHVACYHRDLEPFMARGRQLKAQGKTVTEVQDDRREEVEKGKLLMPTHPAALYSLTGPEGSFDQATGTAVGARALRHLRALGNGGHDRHFGDSIRPAPLADVPRHSLGAHNDSSTVSQTPPCPSSGKKGGNTVPSVVAVPVSLVTRDSLTAN